MNNEAARKDDNGKPRFSFIDRDFLRQLAYVKMHGAEIYSKDNHLKPMEDADGRYVDAAIRHLFSYLDGEATDPKTGRSHLAHAAANCELLFARNK